MNQQGYKAFIYAGVLLTTFGVVAVAADAGTPGVLGFSAGFLLLLVGVVGHMWNRE